MYNGEHNFALTARYRFTSWLKLFDKAPGRRIKIYLTYRDFIILVKSTMRRL